MTSHRLRTAAPPATEPRPLVLVSPESHAVAVAKEALQRAEAADTRSGHTRVIALVALFLVVVLYAHEWMF